MQPLFELPWRNAEALRGLCAALVGKDDPLAPPDLACTPRAVIARAGGARLLRFCGNAAPAGSDGAAPILLVPSIINRWYVLDLRPGSSLIEALVAAGHDVFCIDWGAPEDEDRYFEWDDLLERLRRMVSIVRRTTGAAAVALVGYCMGGTLAAIHAARRPAQVAALVNLLGPIDFESAGELRDAVDPRWFDVDAMVDAGNISAMQMQAGFVALRPTAQIAKWVTLADRFNAPEARAAFLALDAWASDNIPFPAAAYRTYIRDLYQNNGLIRGEHRVLGEPIDLGAINCPVLSIVAKKDNICPPAAATALNRLVSSKDQEVLSIRGGHVGAVVGRTARDVLYPRLGEWLTARCARPA